MPPSSATSLPLYLRHVPKNALLVLLNFAFLPLTTAIVVSSYLATTIVKPKRQIQRHVSGNRKTILVTGVSMTKGLTIARLLSLHTPHRIIGADAEPSFTLSPGRFSSSISTFYTLTPPDGDDGEPYIDSLLHVLKSEKVDLWISCSSVGGAFEDAEVVRLAEAALGSGFKAVQFGVKETERLHEKDQFLAYVESLGLHTPESHRCQSSEEVLEILSKPPKNKLGETKEFILKSINLDDRARGNMMTLLPLQDPQQTKMHVDNLRIAKHNPYLLQEYISGHEYCTHALVVRGRVKAFVACPSSDLLMHYKALPRDSKLSQEMLKFTEKIARDGGESFTGHLSFDFLVRERHGEVELNPIECNPRAHTAVVLFQDTPEMADAYLDIIAPRPKKRDIIYPSSPTTPYYWIGHDFVTLLILPLLAYLSGSIAWEEMWGRFEEFEAHALYWKDGTWAWWDPLPFWVLYHVYWPGKFVASLIWGRAWSRINVSTTKMFEC